MSDLMLLTTFEADEYLSVQEDPILLHNIINVESSRVNRKYTSYINTSFMYYM